MNRLLAILVAAGTATIGTTDAVSMTSAAKTCRVASLSPPTRLEGKHAVARYRRLRRREHRADLMGFRRGPRLGPPSRAELRHIRASLRFRHEFRLNGSRLLIRRLLRTQRNDIDPDGGGTGVPLTAIEVRDLAFRDRVERASGRLARFQSRCVPEAAAGIYLFDRRAGVYVRARFTTRLQRHRRALLRRFPYGPLLKIAGAAFTTVQLQETQDRISRDFDLLRSKHITIVQTDVDPVHDRVTIELKHPRPRAARYLRHRYGRAVRVVSRGR
jgi:hypothetical protein